MDEGSKRWSQITPSDFPWEREGLAYVRSRLPDQDPYRAWSNFEFIADNGAVYECDLLVLCPRGLVLLELKGWPNRLSGDAHTWRWCDDQGRLHAVDNPFPLVNRKAKYLKSLLGRHAPRGSLPFLEAGVFISDPKIEVSLDQAGATSVYGRDPAPDQKRRLGLHGVAAYLTGVPQNRQDSLVSTHAASPIVKAIEKAGIRPSNKGKRAGDYELKKPLQDGVGFQDFMAEHVRLPEVRRRIRIFSVGVSPSKEERALQERAAHREFRVLQGVHHDGILAAVDLTVHELGPAIVYEFDPVATRLDLWLDVHKARLGFADRLGLVRQIAEALRYAHGRRLFHRALSPHSILVSGPPDDPRVKIFSWRAGLVASGGPGRTVVGTSLDTAHAHLLLDPTASAYLAPEAFTDPDADPGLLDVFSLGAVAYHVLSGQPPAASDLELAAVLREHHGLNLAGVLDGAKPDLVALLQIATDPEVGGRMGSVEEFLSDFDDVTAEGLPPTAEPTTVAADQAGKGDVLDGGWVVKRRLGKGSTALALLVTAAPGPDDSGEGAEQVLKVALATTHTARLLDEADALGRLAPHPGIVRLVTTVELDGRTTLVLNKAGDRTLAQVLREEGRIGLDYLERWGDDLLDTLRYLEVQGIAHRDLKPDNLGIAPGKDDANHLVLFDFSLTRAPADQVRAGTPPYLEPFLTQRRPPRWDLHAERYAAAVVLYEMATGTTPTWGDGRTDPAMLPDGTEATIDADAFDPTVREGLAGFFASALRRDPAQRFDTADDMRAAWRQVFQAAHAPVPSDPGDVDTVPATVTDLDHIVADTSLAEAGLSGRALNALERLDVLTVGRLLATPVQVLQRRRGVGNKVRREILAKRAELATAHPDLVRTSQPSTPREIDGPATPASLDTLVDGLLPKASGRNTKEVDAVRLLVGLDPLPGPGTPPAWPTQTQVATALGLTRGRLGQIAPKARARWARDPAVLAVADELVEILAGAGRIAHLDELAAALLQRHGSDRTDEPRRRTAAAAVRALVEAEGSRTDRLPRFVARPTPAGALLALDLPTGDDDQAPPAGEDGPGSEASATDLLAWAERLGHEADALVSGPTPPGPGPAVARLRAVPAPPSAPPLTDARLLRLAAAASTTAVVSPRLELYPRGLDPVRSLRLSAAGLVGVGDLTPAAIVERVQARYPEAAPLPPRPELDQALADADVTLTFDPDSGTYRPPKIPVRGFTSVRTSAVNLTPAATFTPLTFDESVHIDQRLAATVAEGGFLAITANVARAEAAAARLTDLGPTRVSLEALFLRHLQTTIEAIGARWDVVITADAAGPDGAGWTNLLLAVQRSLPALEADLRTTGPHLLLTEPGPLARYDAMGVLERLRDDAGYAGQSVRTAWVLVPTEGPTEMPILDGTQIPVITDTQRLCLPDRWIDAKPLGASP